MWSRSSPVDGFADVAVPDLRRSRRRKPSPRASRACIPIWSGHWSCRLRYRVAGDRLLTAHPQGEFWYQAFHQLPLAAQLIDGDPDAHYFTDVEVQFAADARHFTPLECPDEFAELILIRAAPAPDARRPID